LHQVGDLFELNVKLRCQKVKGTLGVWWNNVPASARCYVCSAWKQ